MQENFSLKTVASLAHSLSLILPLPLPLPLPTPSLVVVISSITFFFSASIRFGTIKTEHNTFCLFFGNVYGY